MNIQRKNRQQTDNENFKIIGVVLWVSFVTAGVATMLFFATFDPLQIIEAATYPLMLSRMSSYSIGFFLFWLLTSSTGAVIAWLLVLPDELNNKEQKK